MHEWDVTVEEALALQEQLRVRVQRTGGIGVGAIKTVAGIDASYAPKGGRDEGRAAVVVYSLPGLAIVDQALTVRPHVFPYVPGLLSFREMPAVLDALAQLRVQPDVYLLDGHGIAHPRRFGLASHLGVYLDRPAIGCAKSPFVGTFAAPGDNTGDWSPLVDAGEEIGAVVWTRPGVKPVFVSIGHKIDLPTAVAVVLRCLHGFRLPEPTRMADIMADPAYVPPRR